MNFHRLLLFCFLFAFAGQLMVSISISKKTAIECCDSDDDSDDTEKELWDSIAITLLDEFTIHVENPTTLIAWKLVPPVSAEWYNAIDNPPEIS